METEIFNINIGNFENCDKAKLQQVTLNTLKNLGNHWRILVNCQLQNFFQRVLTHSLSYPL